jgi:hypothetical protein
VRHGDFAEHGNIWALVRGSCSTTERASSHPLGGAVDVLLTREDAERFIAEVRGDDPELASHLRIEERELRRAG